MDNRNSNLSQARERACDFLRDDDYRLTHAAERDGYALGFTECGMADLLLTRLEEGFPFHEIHLGEPPDRDRPAYVMNKADGRRLYIKFTLESNNLRILSFHSSKHVKDD